MNLNNVFFEGGIFTLGTDYKTREWSTFRIDDVDAVPLPFVLKNDTASVSRLTVPREPPKYQDIVIPASVSIKENAKGKKPFSTISSKVVLESPPKAIITPLERDVEMQSQPTSSSQSVNSQSVSSQSTRNIFGPRNPMESYSFKGTKLSKLSKLSKNKLSCSLATSAEAHSSHEAAAMDDDMFSVHSCESKATQQASKASFTELLNNKSSHDLSEVNPDWPAHQIHSRMMGWKLTSPERRRDLLHLLEGADLSTASLTEEELRQHKQSAGEKELRRIKHIAKRQAEAYEHTVR
jgi:hypothetical protein